MCKRGHSSAMQPQASSVSNTCFGSFEVVMALHCVAIAGLVLWLLSGPRDWLPKSELGHAAHINLLKQACALPNHKFCAPEVLILMQVERTPEVSKIVCTLEA